MSETPYINSSGELYIEAEHAGMHYFCLLADGVPIYTFEGGNVHAIKVDDAIKWHRDEIERSGGEWRSDYLEALILAKENFRESNGRHT